MKGRSKQLILNELMKEYKVGVDFNSIKLEKYSYNDLNNESLKENFEEISIDYNEASNIYNTDISYYNTSKIYQPYSLVISNIYDNQVNKILDSSYVLYYNSSIGLKQLSYTFQEGNGLYNSSNGLTFNIDNNTLKTYIDSNNLDTLYYNIDTIPNSTYNRFGISSINESNFKVNNGIISLNDNVLLTFITMKNNIKNSYYTLSSIYEQFKYFEDIEIEFENQKLKEIGEDNTYETSKIPIEDTSTYIICNQEISFIDDDYYNKNIVPLILPDYEASGGKYPVKLNGNKLAFCKDLNQIKIIISNNINNTSLNLYYDDDLIYPTSLKDISSYLTINYKDSRNRFQINNYIESSSNFKTINRIKYINTQVGQSVFNHYGVSLNVNLKTTYFVTTNQYTYYLFTSNDDPIKIVYDYRNIKYCAYNTQKLKINKYYMFIPDEYSNETYISLNWVLLVRLKDMGLIWKAIDPYIFIGYNQINNRNYYYPIWQNEICMYYYIPIKNMTDVKARSISLKDYPHLNDCLYINKLHLCEVEVSSSSIKILNKIPMDWKYEKH